MTNIVDFAIIKPNCFQPTSLNRIVTKQHNSIRYVPQNLESRFRVLSCAAERHRRIFDIEQLSFSKYIGSTRLRLDEYTFRFEKF